MYGVHYKSFTKEQVCNKEVVPVRGYLISLVADYITLSMVKWRLTNDLVRASLDPLGF